MPRRPALTLGQGVGAAAPQFRSAVSLPPPPIVENGRRSSCFDSSGTTTCPARGKWCSARTLGSGATCTRLTTRWCVSRTACAHRTLPIEACRQPRALSRSWQHEAARDNKVGFVEMLIVEGGFNVNAQAEEELYTALHIAVEHRSVDCCRKLLDLGADTAIISVRPPPPDPRSRYAGRRSF